MMIEGESLNPNGDNGASRPGDPEVLDSVMTIEQLDKRFEAEWILLGDPEMEGDTHVLGGRVLAHSDNRDEVYRAAIRLKTAALRVSLYRASARGRRHHPVSHRFDPARPLVIVAAKIEGPASTTGCRLALDTGATRTVIHPAVLTTAGYDLAMIRDRIELTAAHGTEYAVRLRVPAPACARPNHGVVRHHLTCSCRLLRALDGLLGLDFFRGMRLMIDFRAGVVELD